MGVEIRGEEERDKERERERERPSQKRHSPPRAGNLVKLLRNEGSRYCFWNPGEIWLFWILRKEAPLRKDEETDFFGYLSVARQIFKKSP